MIQKVKSFLNRVKEKQKKASIQKGLVNKSFTIVSDNCWGGYVYQHLMLPYNTPFVGLFIFSPCYIELLKEFPDIMQKELIFISPDDSKYASLLKEWRTINTYPVALLGSSEIHFLHYTSKEEALEKWNRRKERMNYSNILFKFCDRDLFSSELGKAFESLPFKNKLFFAGQVYEGIKNQVILPADKNGNVENEWDFYQKYINIKDILNNLV